MSENNTISREALLIYLEDLRTLETIKENSIMSKNKMEQELETAKLNVKYYEDNWKKRLSYKPSMEEYKKDTENSNKGILALVGGISWIFIGIVFIAADFSFIGGLSLFIGIPLIFYAIYLMIKSSYVNKRSYKEYQERKAIHDEYIIIREKDNETRKQRYFDEKSKFEKMTVDVDNYKNEINNDLTRIQDQLDKAYNANIIPMQFRDIHGVYYLYDYLSTSGQSLSEALMQCNLESIKSKLDQMIQLQGVAIVEQAKANQTIIQQNQELLDKAQSIEQNTFVAAQYSKISALNSAVSLELQKKQLTYQMADFWLK